MTYVVVLSPQVLSVTNRPSHRFLAAKYRKIIIVFSSTSFHNSNEMECGRGSQENYLHYRGLYGLQFKHLAKSGSNMLGEPFGRFWNE